MSHPSPKSTLAHHAAGLFAQVPQVAAVALGGSLVGPGADAASDIDLYVFTCREIGLAEREQLVARAGGASIANLGLTFWGPGDEWYDATTGIEVDIVYFDVGWTERELKRVLDEHQASMGYTTCYWHTIRNLQIFADAQGWLQTQQAYSLRPYPEPLRRNIIALNQPVLRKVIPAYAHQLEKAVNRGDLVSVNHRLAALLASYFDVLFAVNCTLHPGEKRLVARTQALCAKLPENFAEDIDTVLQMSAAADAGFLHQVDVLLDHLDELLAREGCDPHAFAPQVIQKQPL